MTMYRGGDQTVDYCRSTAEVALAGLSQVRKTLPAKLFYDEAGCQLFGCICTLPEYYLTRTERTLLATCGRDVAIALGSDSPVVLVEYGASSEDKALLLMGGVAEAGIQVVGYVPVDVAAHALAALRARLAASHPSLPVTPLIGDFDDAIVLPDDGSEHSKLGFFPGSTIGNFDPSAARAFLARCRSALGDDSHFLIGYDLCKPREVLVPAYDDAQGVTAAFNLNLLHRLNRECNADFVVERFSHQAIWNERDGRIEMHLVSAVAQTVQVAGVAIHFQAGETIHTENSYKHTIPAFSRMAAAAGWEIKQSWTDSSQLFALQLLKATS